MERRRQIGHWGGDTVMGPDLRHCLLTLVERATGYTAIKKLIARNKAQATAALLKALAEHREQIKTITFDNGTEFHDYKVLERQFGIKCCFATQHIRTRSKTGRGDLLRSQVRSEPLDPSDDACRIKSLCALLCRLGAQASASATAPRMLASRRFSQSVR